MLLARATTTTCAIILALAMPANAASETTVTLFSPWSGRGLRDGFTVSEKAQGSCSTHSLVTDRADAWRCFEGDDIIDPCFARALRALAVACAQSPFSHRLVLLSLKKPLSGNENATTRWLQPKGEPWGLRLTNGDTCVFATGATDAVRGERLNYACRRTGWIIGAPDRSTAIWSARSVDYPHGNITRVHIAMAIF
jgi:eukaryotic-like serine/threonine-protein kinase